MGDMGDYYNDLKAARKAEREARREEAKRRMDEVRDIAHHVELRDQMLTHVSVFLSENRSIEWWPGTAKWASGSRGQRPDGHGGMDSFLGFLRKAAKRHNQGEV